MTFFPLVLDILHTSNHFFIQIAAENKITVDEGTLLPKSSFHYQKFGSGGSQHKCNETRDEEEVFDDIGDDDNLWLNNLRECAISSTNVELLLTDGISDTRDKAIKHMTMF